MSDVGPGGVPLPPQELVFMNKSAEEGLNQGRSQVRKLAHFGLNVHDGLVFDLGCGYGRLAYGLLASGFRGRYVGLDITPDRIAWLRENFTPLQPRYTFVHEDVKNDQYNPGGAKGAPRYDAALGGEAPDTIILLSVFTHMYEDDIRAHLANIRAVMSPATKLLVSCFLFDGPGARGVEQGTARRTFAFELSDHARYDKKNRPLAAIAFTEPFMASMLREAGLDATFHRGTWTGQPTEEDAFAQDIAICRVAGSH